MQAVIITAYHNPEQVYKLANLLKDKFEVYIHFDKKMNVEKINCQHFEKLPNVHIYSLFHVNWGGEPSVGNLVFMQGSIKEQRHFLCPYNFRRRLAVQKYRRDL